MLLKDKVVIISGIGPGLGQSLAVKAAEQGAKLAIAARTASKLDEAEKAVAELGLGTDLIKVPTDITDKDQCKALVDKTIEHFGRIDCLINSAYSPGTFEPIEAANLEGWRMAMDVNLFGTMNLTLETIPYLKENGGSIVNVNTMVTRKPMATQGGYGASKAALASATQHMAVELGQHNIRVNSTFMGWMWGTPVKGYVDWQVHSTKRSEEEVMGDITKNIPLGRIPTDAECANAVIFLASDYACAITGACLDVNGGEYLSH